MTKDEAKHKGYCEHCAAWGHDRGCRCGITASVKTDQCGLPAEVVERWKGEFGLEGTTRRSPSKDSFGDGDLMKKRRGWGEKRYLK
jgi:hypothetical protein